MAIDNRYDEEDVEGATIFQKGEITTSTQNSPVNNSMPTERQSTKTHTVKSTSQVLPTSREAHREAIYQDTHRGVDREVYQKSTKILLKAHIETATMKLTGESPKRTSKDVYQIKMNLRVNAMYRWLPAARYTLQSMRKRCMKAQESAGLLELGKYNHVKEAYVLDVDEWRAIDIYNPWSPKAT